jgi:endonuclease YncB( thermonuclease family)
MRWLLLLLLVVGHGVYAETISGQVVGIADGDTLTILDTSKKRYKIRLADIDAPERGQAFYKRSRQSLSAICFKRSATVETQGKDRWGRYIAKVNCAGVDANGEQVRRGMAWTFKRYAPMTSALYEIEGYARLRQLGLWADPKPVAPWDFRDARRGKPR